MIARRSATGADVVAEVLAEAGIRHMFGVPGGGATTDLIEAGGRAGVEFILCHTETAAGFAAATYGELTGHPGVFLTTLGPGVSSACNALAHAYLDRDPVVLMSDCHPASVDGLEHQRFDHARLLEPITKRSLAMADDPAGVLRVALRTAREGQPGPVHIDVAPDVTPRECKLPAARDEPTAGSGPQAAPGLEQAAEMLARARKPIVIAGLGVRGAAAAEALRALAERGQLPVLVTYKGKGAFPDDHPLHAGIMTGGTLEEPLVAAADLIVGVGFDPVELIPRKWPYSCPVLYVGAWPHNPRHFSATAVISDVAAATRALGTSVTTACEWDAGAIAARKQEQLDRLRLPTRGLAPHRVVELAREGTADEPVVTVDAGAHMFAVTNFWATARPNGFLISNGLASMGYALPAATAAALLHPDERVVCFTGDGGLAMCLSELETLARLQLKVTVAVFDDNALSLIKIKQDQKSFQPSGVHFRHLDWRKIAEGLGCAVLTAADEAGFTAAWRQAQQAAGPVLIDAHIDAESYGGMIAALRG